jgi:hypothetical protein
VRQRYLDQLRSEMNRFAAVFQGPILDVKAVQIDEWLRSRNQGPRSRNTVIKLLRMLFFFARGRRYLMRMEKTEADALSTVKVGDVETEIDTPEQFGTILKHPGRSAQDLRRHRSAVRWLDSRSEITRPAR